MLRVLSISTLFPSEARPGFGLFVARQAQALALRGDVEMVVLHPISRFGASKAERGLPARSHDWGVEVHYPRFTTIPRFGTRWNPALIASALLPLARKLHREHPFDVVDAQFFYPDGPAAARIAKALGLPLSIKARGSDIHHWGTQGFALPQILKAADQAAGLLSVSAALRADMVSLGIEAEKIAVHYTGLDHARFHPMPRNEARKQVADLAPVDGALLVSVGNLIPLKGHHLAIEALAALPNARLVLAGKGPEEASLKALAQSLNVAERVHFAGSLTADRLAVLLSAANVMVLASEREGLANAWIEALACGTPIVITDAGGAREVVTGPDAGRIAPRNAAAIAEAVGDLLAHPPEQSATARYAGAFSWQANAEQLAAHYKRITRSV